MVPFNRLRFCSKKDLCFHRLTERIDRRVGYLRSVQQHPVKINRVVFRIAHAGQQHAATVGLPVNFTDCLCAPVGIFFICIVRFDDFEGPGRTQRYTPLTIDTFRFVRCHAVRPGNQLMNVIGALSLADPAGNASILISDNLIFRIKHIYRHAGLPPFKYTSTGCPPCGDQMVSRSGSIARMAASSLEK